jgi:hypothetical protein
MTVKSNHDKNTNKDHLMKFITPIAAFASISLLSGCVIAINPAHAEFQQTKTLTLNSQALNKLKINTGAGSLIIRGKKELKQIEVTADIYTSGDNKNNYQLSLTNENNQARLTAKIDSSGFWQGNSPHIDIIILVPQTMMLDINDGSGNIKINNLNANIELTDGSGDVEIKAINGDLVVNDGSGELTIAKISGTVKVKDGSGDLQLKSIQGNVNINDGSGAIMAKNINGRLDIVDGSGDLTVKKVSQAVTIDDGSGDIDIKNVGSLKILEAGSGGLHIDKVSGNFSIDS